mmetsp:Transcript_118660/g.383157  ORF Transcript_118660/g.383157 Transcript_118660/m.383157 type:complete len:339 (-) Transcript_118660:901-1917(-)
MGKGQSQDASVAAPRAVLWPGLSRLFEWIDLGVLTVALDDLDGLVYALRCLLVPLRRLLLVVRQHPQAVLLARDPSVLLRRPRQLLRVRGHNSHASEGADAVHLMRGLPRKPCLAPRRALELAHAPTASAAPREDVDEAHGKRTPLAIQELGRSLLSTSGLAEGPRADCVVLANDGSNPLLQRDEAVLVLVELVNKALDLLGPGLTPQLCREEGCNLALVDSAAAILVHGVKVLLVQLVLRVAQDHHLAEGLHLHGQGHPLALAGLRGSSRCLRVQVRRRRRGRLGRVCRCRLLVRQWVGMRVLAVSLDDCSCGLDAVLALLVSLLRLGLVIPQHPQR